MKERVYVWVWWPVLLGLLFSGLQPVSFEMSPRAIAVEDLMAFNEAQACGQPPHSDNSNPAQHCPPCLAVSVWTAFLPEPPPSLCGPLGWQGIAVQDALPQPAFAVAHPSRAPPAHSL